MNQILSQDEVEALLKAVGSDDWEPGEDGEDGSSGRGRGLGIRGALRGLALISTQTTRFTYSQEKRFEELRPLLEDLTNRTIAGFRNFLIGSLEKEFSIERVTLEHLNFSDFAQRYDLYGRPFAFTPFRVLPTDRSCLAVFEPPLSIGLVEGFMGGTLMSSSKGPWRSLTPIEIRITEKMCRELGKELEDAWQVHRDVSIKMGNTTANPHMAGKLREFGLAVIIGLKVSLRGNPMGQCYLVIPYSVMEQLHPSSQTAKVEVEDDGLAWSEALNKSMVNLSLTFSVELGQTALTLRQLLGLKQGDVVPISEPVAGKAVAKVEGNPKFTGVPGLYQGRKAVRIC